MLTLFLNNNREHFAKFNSCIAYGNDRLRHLVVELGFDMIYRSQEQSNSLFVRNG